MLSDQRKKVWVMGKGEKMTREQAKANLQAIGIEEPTAEQITNYLNQVNGETKKEKDRADKYKAGAELSEELQKKLEDIQTANLTEIEKANLLNEQANQKITTLENTIKTMELKTSLAENGIVGEDADSILTSLSNGTFNADVLGQIISKKTESAIAEKEKEWLEKTPNPKGGSGGADDEKSSAEKFAEEIGSRLGNADKTAKEVVAKYL